MVPVRRMRAAMSAARLAALHAMLELRAMSKARVADLDVICVAGFTDEDRARQFTMYRAEHATAEAAKQLLRRGVSSEWGDQAAFANSGRGWETGSKRWPNPAPRAPL
jgi:hypothetical protein